MALRNNWWRSSEGQIDPDPGFDGKFRIGFGLRDDNGESGRGNPRAWIADDPATDARVAPGQYDVGHDFLQPPAAGHGQQVLLAFCFGDFDQVFGAQTGGFRQDRTSDRDLVVAGKAANDRRRRLRDRRQLAAHFSQRNAGAYVCDRPNLDRLDEPFQHISEQLDLLAVEAFGGRQKQVGHALDCFQALFCRPIIDCRFNFVDD